MFPLGLGTYLGRDDDATDALYRDAIGRALAAGVEVIDTAINYRSQRSERVIGEALAGWPRDKVVVTTKGGYLPRGFDPKGLIGPGELVAGCHCMTPRYLADQLARSLENLRLERIDVYYLHNIETQLDEVPRAELVRRSRAAFEFLEARCAEGVIGRYGTATWNGYRVPPSQPEHLPLEELVAAAREVGGEGHHFRALQLPYSPSMPEAAGRRTQRWKGRDVSVLEAAADAGMTVMTSASLAQGRLSPRQALPFILDTPGVSVALVGMKTARHVDENVAAVTARG